MVSFLRKFLPLLTFSFFSIIALILWQTQNAYERELILHHTETSVEQARIRINGMLSARVASLEILADRWVERQPPDFSRQRFLSFARSLFEHYPGFTAIQWIDPSGSIQWCYPSEASPKWEKINPFSDARLRAALDEAGQGKGPVITPAVEFEGGEKGFEVILPLVHEGQLQGYLSGVFLLAKIVESSLPKSLLDDFHVTILEGDQPIFRSGPGSVAPNEGSIHSVRAVGFEDKVWRLHMVPGSRLYSPQRPKNVAILVFGIVLAAALSLLLHLLLHRMQMYRESRDLAIHEVNERKRAEATLRENEQKLESLLSELSSKNAELESFIYTISHDLKTPIVTIDGFIGALREDFGTNLPEDAEKYLKYMSDAARKMEVLINDLLDLSRIGRLVAKKTEVPLGDIVKDALETLQPQIEARGICVDVQANLPLVYGERKRLGQVIYNLLNNAVKYIGRNNPSPRISLGVEEQDGRNVFFVKDNGIGIEERYFQKIFQIFERLPAAKERGEGTGIGLTIVKRIIEHHGGKIWVASEPGKGTTFFFTLKDKDS